MTHQKREPLGRTGTYWRGLTLSRPGNDLESLGEVTLGGKAWLSLLRPRPDKQQKMEGGFYYH